jgi:hypothetical protein
MACKPMIYWTETIFGILQVFFVNGFEKCFLCLNLKKFWMHIKLRSVFGRVYIRENVFGGIPLSKLFG